jgi:hypothetical protein
MLILRFFLKLLLSVCAAFGILGFVKTLVSQRFFIPGNLNMFLVFAGGMLVFTVVWFMYLGRRENFWSTLEHELTHAFFATLFLKKINSLSASRRKGGFITIEGGNAIIALSPYFFPLAPLIILFIGLLLPAGFQHYVAFVLGFFYQFHLLNLIKEVHLDQPDLKMSGYLFSVIIILFFNVFFLGIFLAAISGGTQPILHFIWDGLKNSVYLMFNIREYFSNFSSKTIN